MNLIYYKLLSAVIIFFASIVVILYPLRSKARPSLSESAELGDALASGIFFGAALFHMLPDAINSFATLYPEASYPYAELICALGFVFLLFLERFSSNSPLLAAKDILPYMLLTLLTIHALIEGAALGIGNNYSETTLLFIAIIAHKGTETFALAVILLRHNISLQHIVFIIIFFACMTPLGILSGASIDLISSSQHAEMLAACVNAFAAGTFLYISTLHHVHFHKHAKDVQSMTEFGCLVLGVAAMAGIAIWT